MADAKLHMNLQQVRRNIERDMAITPTRQRDLISALNTLSKWLGLPLDEIPADRKDIRTGFERLNHSQLGVTKKRFDNVRSLVDKALDGGMVGVFKASTEPIAEAWQQVLQLVPEGWQRFKLSQLARYCSHVDIAPSEVCAETFETWTAWRAETAPLAKHPGRIVNDVWTLWNRCAAEIANWPYAPIHKPSKQRVVLCPLTDLPVSLQKELEEMEKAMIAGSLKSASRRSDEVSSCRRRGKKGVSARVAQNRVTAVQHGVQALVDRGEAKLQDLKSVRDIVSPDNADLLADVVIERTGKVTEYPHSLVKDLRAVAVQWLKVDKDEIDGFNEVLNSLKQEAGMGGLTPENRKRLQPFKNPQNVSRLVSLPCLIFDKLESDRKKRGGKVTILMACKARSAIAITVLTMLPVRRANLATIELGKHLVVPTTTKDQAYLTFEPKEIKNTRAIGCAVPDSKWELLDLYLKHYRPVILKSAVDGSPSLLPTQTGETITGRQLADDVGNLIRKETGLTVNLHLFRHLMAAIILRERPGQYDTVRSLLGHSKSSRVTELYAEIESEVASQVLDAAIEVATSHRRRKRPVTRKWSR